MIPLNPIQKFAEDLQQRYVWYAGIFYSVCLLLSFVHFYFLPAGLMLWEVLLHGIFTAAYGRAEQGLFGYFLVDHPLYGNGFRSRTRSRELKFLVLDKFVFPPQAGRILDPSENMRSRLDFNINSLGFRGREFDVAQKKNRLRIFCSGGSTTACDCNHDDETWPARLEQYLRDNQYDVEVVNAGVQGWYSYQELLRFKNEIATYQPDIVLLHQGWNEEFEFSSLSLGKTWQPRRVRNVIEENYLYCPPHPVWSQNKILSFYLGLQQYFKKLVFNRNMNFQNPERWKVLKNREYILAWFDNLAEFAKMADQNRILLYTVDYPGLVDFSDEKSDRQFYVEHSRLTDWYGDYQAVSKKRISRTLEEASPIIPLLSAQKSFADIRRQERLSLFHDEIHMTPRGNRLFAESIGDLLMGNDEFKKRYENGIFFSNVRIDDALISRIRNQLATNPAYLDRFIDEKIDQLEGRTQSRATTQNEIPADRYTTF